ncbi:MAG: acyltransferase [Deltaproteobacteria bacterium]|nr:acyltransferase [Deltaproteobacteria bacterium]
MPRPVRVGLIQTSNPINDASAPIETVKQAALDRTIPLVETAGQAGVQILCLQELFAGPYFCPDQSTRWYEAAEPAEGPTVEALRPYARKYAMALVVPIFETPMAGVYYNTAVVLDADGSTLGLYRKCHLPHVAGFWEKFYFKPGNLGYPTFRTRYARIGVYTCYDRHFPEGARLLGLNGAEIVFNPSATVAGLAQYLWKLEQPAHAVANGYFIAAINRVGVEAPWNIGRFFGSSYICDPRGRFLVEASEDRDELVHADCDLDLITEVRNLWQFFRDRRPETYGDLTRLLP